MKDHFTWEVCHFRLIRMPCCSHLLCWVNPRLPNYCPECGKKSLVALRTDGSHIRHSDPRAEIKVHELGQGLLGGFSARPEHQEEEQTQNASGANHKDSQHNSEYDQAQPCNH